MPKILFLTVHRPNRSPSQRFRFEQYLPFLKENGFEYLHFFLLNEADDRVMYSKGKILAKLILVLKSIYKLMKLLPKAKAYDFIFIQRECFMLGTSFFEKKLSKLNSKLIFDFDDAIWLLDVSKANKSFAWLKDPNKVAEIISFSDTVVAGNSYLADYARQFNKNVKIIPTTVDTSLYSKKKTKSTDKICIGWTGSITTIKYFEDAVPVLLKLKQKFGDKICFKVIGDPLYNDESLEIKGIGWNQETEIEELSEFDIGIMPQPYNEWTKGKCAFKGLLYMALEIPAVLSPVGVNAELIKDGENGFLAATEDEWIEKLSRLIESKELRLKIGKAGKETVEKAFSVESQKNNYLALFKNS